MEKVKKKKDLINKGLTHIMEQMRGVKPPSQPWQGRILIVEPHLQMDDIQFGDNMTYLHQIATTSTSKLIIPKIN